MQVAKELTTTQEVIVEQASFARPLSEMTQQLLRLRMIPPLPELIVFLSRLPPFPSSALIQPCTVSSSLALLPYQVITRYGSSVLLSPNQHFFKHLFLSPFMLQSSLPVSKIPILPSVYHYFCSYLASISSFNLPSPSFFPVS